MLVCIFLSRPMNNQCLGILITSDNNNIQNLYIALYNLHGDGSKTVLS